MTKRMLIDAAHPEETRVVIVDSNRVEELDFESRHKRQLRGNVYLARVTRVEPSLQAAFIEYGGNRHGFLAFSEIHPDYYRIPEADKQALKAQEEEDQRIAEEQEETRKAAQAKRKSRTKSDEDEEADEEESEDEADEDEEEFDENLDPDDDDATDAEDAEVADEQVKVASKRRKRISRRRYKIQEVVKRGQILLVQAVKEERGNKGAAMTTYLSLAGRYCVLMPNTPRGGGISRKIANGNDRKRLKSIMNNLEVPQGMGVIVRTAGAKRTKADIERDYDYLSRLWSEIRETTMNSSAPALIHEEGNLVKRSIRDLYNKDIEEVLVQGADAYETANNFINMLMPANADDVKHYEDDIPLFLRYNVEQQIENSLDATVQLKSGGYLVIHPTEALVSVDVNSGRSTKQRNVERTALNTNLEAAEEVARQMRLRDLAGLIVIDFIDMDENKNNRAVEKRMKDALSRDRARIQTSRISQFGLMEISRQRRRRSLLEGSTTSCPHCGGVGRKRTIESSALAAIRAVEEFAVRGKAKRIRLKTSQDVALYLLNEKRELLTLVDQTADVFTEVVGDDDLIRPAFEVEVIEKRSDKRADPMVQIEKDFKKEREQAKRKPKKRRQDNDRDDEEEGETKTSHKSDSDEENRSSGRKRSRRGRRGGRGRSRREETSSKESTDETLEVIETDKPEQSSEDKPKRRRRRRAPAKGDSAKSEAVEAPAEDTTAEEKPSKRRSTTRRKAPSRNAKAEKTPAEDVTAEDKPKRTRRKAPAKKATETTETVEETKPKRTRKAPAKAKADDAKEAPKRKRKAPAKKAAEADGEEKPKRTRKAPAKKAATKKAPAKAKADDAAEEKPKRTRKAPTKAKAAKAEDAKSKRTRKAPAKAAEPEAEEKPKRTRKAPAKKAPAKTEAKAEEKPKRARKAPAKKPAAKAEPAPAKPAAAPEKPAEAAKPAPEKKKRRGWWARRKD
jgi:ribonuclease E